MKRRKKNHRVREDAKVQRYTLITLFIIALILIVVAIATGENKLKSYKPVDSIEEIREYHELRIQEMYPNEDIKIILFN